jgi:hypothetical protein
VPEDTKTSGGLLDEIRKLYEQGGRDAIWTWCMAPPHEHGKAKRFNAAAHFARNQRDNSQGDERKSWADARKVYAQNRDKWEAAYEEQHPDLPEWPDTLNIAERLYETPNNHFHLASPERDKLIVIAGIVQQQFQTRIGEFPPFDHVEGVHTGISWHYRNPAQPYVGVTYAQAASHLDLHGDWGCAMDVNDLDGGSDQEYAAYIEVGRRYV